VIEKIKLVQGDTRPAIVCVLTDVTSDTAINLAGATVRLKFRAAGEDVLTATILGAITDASTGTCVFYPASAPEMLTGEPGYYEGEIEITFSDGQVQTVYELLKFMVREDF